MDVKTTTVTVTTQFSPSDWAVTKAKDFYEINKTDGYATTGAKVIGRTLSHTALAIAALVETVATAAFTVILSPLYFAHNSSFNALTTATTLAARATVENLRAIVGYPTAKPVIVAPEPKPQTKLEWAKAQVINASKVAKSYTGAALNKVYDNRYGIAKTAAYTTAALTALYYGAIPLRYVRDTALNWTPEAVKNNVFVDYTVKPAFNLAKDYVIKPVVGFINTNVTERIAGGINSYLIQPIAVRFTTTAAA